MPGWGWYRRWKRAKRALTLVLQGRDPTDHGYTREEENKAVDEFNQIAANKGWNIRRGKMPRTRQPKAPGLQPTGKVLVDQDLINKLDLYRCEGCGAWFTGNSQEAIQGWHEIVEAVAGPDGEPEPYPARCGPVTKCEPCVLLKGD